MKRKLLIIIPAALLLIGAVVLIVVLCNKSPEPVEQTTSPGTTTASTSAETTPQSAVSTPESTPTPTPEPEVYRFASVSPGEAAELFGVSARLCANERYIFFTGCWDNSQTETLLKRDRISDEVTPVCVDPACPHTKASGCILTGSDLLSYKACGDDLYFVHGKLGSKNVAYTLHRYNVNTGESQLIYKGNEHSVISFENGGSLVYRRAARNENDELVKTFYKITPEGESVKIFQVTDSAAQVCMWRDRYLLEFEASERTLRPFLCDTVTGETQQFDTLGRNYSGAHPIADRYLLMLPESMAFPNWYLLDLETGEMTDFGVSQSCYLATSKYLCWLESKEGKIQQVGSKRSTTTTTYGNILHIYDPVTGKEDIYDLPDLPVVSSKQQLDIVDGKVLFGRQIINYNGKKTNVYDFQVDILTGKMRFLPEEPTVYSKDAPAYIEVERGDMLCVDEVPPQT